MTREIKIQEDYWTGTKCLENQIPWVVPAAVHYLDSLCKPDDMVLDLGTGGSTLFYANRCMHVLALETNPQWYGRVKREIDRREIKNVDYQICEQQRLIEEFIERQGEFDIISVDTVHGYNRSAFLKAVLPKARRVIVLDNYADEVLFPWHHSVEGPHVKPGWDYLDFEDSHWVGKGTRVVFRP